MDKKIADKIKEVLSEEDQKVFEAAITKKVTDSVALREEEIKKEYDALSKKYCEKRIAEETAKIQASLIESYDGKMDQLEGKIVARLDGFFDHIITEQISDDAITTAATDRILSPLVEEIRQVFAKHYVTLDSDGSKALKESTNKIGNLEKQLSEAILSKMEAEEGKDKVATFLLISEKVDGLTETQKNRVVTMFKDKKFEEVKGQIDNFVSLIKESKETRKTQGDKKTIDTVISEDDNIKTEKKVIKENEENSFYSMASRFLD